MLLHRLRKQNGTEPGRKGKRGVTPMGITQLVNLHVWRDEHMGRLWRVSYDEGDGETYVSFPDTAALGDFLNERLGLLLADETRDFTQSDYPYYGMPDDMLDVIPA